MHKGHGTGKKRGDCGVLRGRMRASGEWGDDDDEENLLEHLKMP